MAEGLFKKLLCSFGIYSVNVSSAGLQVYPSSAVSANAVRVASELGCDISSHVPRQLTREILSDAELVVCMSRSHSQAIKTAMPGCAVLVLGENGVFDPYGGDISAYRRAAASIINGFPELSELISGRALHIRKMRASDIPSLAATERSCFSMPWSENALYSELSNPHARFFTAIIGKRVVGYVGSHIVCGEMSVTNVAVEADMRRKGVGAALMDSLWRCAERENAQFVTLEVRKSNSAAIKLYEKLGYTLVGERRDFYENPRENALLYTKFGKENAEV